MKNVGRYEGQALAIIMIVIVIAVVLGMAMLSRTLRDSQRVVDEKSSAEAIEATDAVIDSIKGTSLATLKNVCSQEKYGGGIANGCTVKGVSEVNTFLSELGAANDVSSSLKNCSAGSTSLEVKTTLTTVDDELEIQQDSVRSFALRGQNPSPTSCTLDLYLEPKGSLLGGVSISLIYGQSYTNGVPASFKEYVFSDTTNYCVYKLGGDCSISTNFKDSWTPLSSGTKLSIPLAPNGTYYLDEIRVRAVNSAISLRSGLSNANCVANTEMIKMVVGANCTGAYRAKEVQLPQTDAALPIFDYVLFNGNGLLQGE